MDDGARAFYGLSRQPFGPVREPALLFQAASRRALIDGALADLLAGRAVVAVEGTRGIGKTTLLDALAAEVEGHGPLVVVLQGQLRDPMAVQRRIGDALGVRMADVIAPERLFHAVQADAHFRDSPFQDSKFQEGHPAEGRLMEFGLLAGGRTAEPVVLCVDDAEAVSSAVFRYLWLLHGLFAHGTTRLQLLLAGAPGAWPGLAHPDLAELRHLAADRRSLMPLRGGEAEAYLDHKLHVAGGSRRKVMNEAAAAALVQEADGVPGQLDMLTERVLERGFLQRRKRIKMPALHEALFKGSTIGDLLGDGPSADPWLRVAVPRRKRWRWMAGGTAVAAGIAGAAMLLIGDPQPPPARHAAATPGLALPAMPMTAFPGPASPVPARSVPASRVPLSDVPAPPPLTAAGPDVSAAPASDALAPAAIAEAPVAARPIAAGASTVVTAVADVPAAVVPGAPPATLVPVVPGSSPLALPAPPPPAALAALPPAEGAPPAAPPLAAPDALDPAPQEARPQLQPPQVAEALGEQPAPPASGVVTATAEPDPSPSQPPPAAPSRSPSSTAEASTDGAESPPVKARESQPATPGLVLVAQAGDTMPALYERVYRGLTPPPYAKFVAANHLPLHTGALVVFPTPPHGWRPKPGIRRRGVAVSAPATAMVRPDSAGRQ